MVSVLPIHTTVDQYCANSTIKQQMSVMLSVVHHCLMASLMVVTSCTCRQDM